VNTLCAKPMDRARPILAGLLVGLLGACSTPSFPPAPVSASSADYNYLIGPGDTLNIIVWRNPELSMTVPVRPDGKVATPLRRCAEEVSRKLGYESTGGRVAA